MTSLWNVIFGFIQEVANSWILKRVLQNRIFIEIDFLSGFSIKLNLNFRLVLHSTLFGNVWSYLESNSDFCPPFLQCCQCTQCGNSRIFLLHIFYVKSIAKVSFPFFDLFVSTKSISRQIWSGRKFLEIPQCVSTWVLYCTLNLWS